MGFQWQRLGKARAKGLRARSLKVRSGSGPWTSLTAGAQALSWEPGRKAGAGQGREGLGKLVKEFELPMLSLFYRADKRNLRGSNAQRSEKGGLQAASVRSVRGFPTLWETASHYS